MCAGVPVAGDCWPVRRLGAAAITPTMRSTLNLLSMTNLKFCELVERDRFLTRKRKDRERSEYKLFQEPRKPASHYQEVD
jgi:hypothetical protein